MERLMECEVCGMRRSHGDVCPDCYQVTAASALAIQKETVRYTVCEKHGAVVVSGRPCKVGGDRGVGGKWVWRCPPCGFSGDIPEQVKVDIERRSEEWIPEWQKRVDSFKASGGDERQVGLRREP